MGKNQWGAVVLMTAAVAVASCGQDREGAPVANAPERVADARYAYALSHDAAGTYVPVGDYALRNWRLKQIVVGGGEAFTGWQAAGRASSAAPLKLVFEDGQDINPETGQARTLTLIPAAFDLRDDEVVIEAVSGGLGEVRFDGALDSGAADGAVALTGQLKIGTQTFEDAELKLKTGG